MKSGQEIESIFFKLNLIVSCQKSDFKSQILNFQHPDSISNYFISLYIYILMKMKTVGQVMEAKQCLALHTW